MDFFVDVGRFMPNHVNLRKSIVPPLLISFVIGCQRKMLFIPRRTNIDVLDSL